MRTRTPSSFRIARPLALALIWGAPGLAAAGCGEPTDLGHRCSLWIEGDPAATIDLTILDTVNPGCRERLCHKQGGYLCPAGLAECLEAQRQPLEPVCMTPCETSADCAGGDPDANGCREYVCKQFGPESGWGDHCGCVCLDAIRDDQQRTITRAELEAAPEKYGGCGVIL